MAKKETMDAVETTIDTVAETVDTLERIPQVRLNGTTRNQQVLILSTVAFVSATAGAVAGYYVIDFIKSRRNNKKKPTVVVSS